MNRGAVVWVDLSDASPPQLGNRPPPLLLSQPVPDQVPDTLVAVPVSSRPPEIYPLRLRLAVPSLKRTSYGVVPGLRQIKKTRILGSAGRLTAADLARLDSAIHDYLRD